MFKYKYLAPQVQVLQNCTRVRLEYKYKHQVLHLCLTLTEAFDLAQNWPVRTVLTANGTAQYVVLEVQARKDDDGCPSRPSKNSVKSLEDTVTLLQYYSAARKLLQFHGFGRFCGRKYLEFLASLISHCHTFWNMRLVWNLIHLITVYNW